MWQRHFPGLLVQLLISKPLWYNIRSFKAFTLIDIRLQQEAIQLPCGISLIAFKYYHKLFLAFGKTVLRCLIDLGLIRVLLINTGTWDKN